METQHLPLPKTMERASLSKDEAIGEDIPRDKPEVLPTPPPPPSPASLAAPPSPLPSSTSSSPSHEFSFTISFHPSSVQPPLPCIKNRATAQTPPSAASSAALDLSPADDIFFHGHLLPLHLLSHLHVSPRSSTNSLDSLTIPIRDSSQNHCQNPTKNGTSNRQYEDSSTNCTNPIDIGPKERFKSKSFSLFGMARRRKGCENRDGEEKEKQRRKLRLDVTRVLKRYLSMMRPFLLFRRQRKDGVQICRQAYSFSGNLMLRGGGRQGMMQGRRGEFSAPASMRASPANSGILLEKAMATPPPSANDSTMEELQAAIQAAIAHCKNSIAVDEKLKC